jgi:hypothetical protein
MINRTDNQVKNRWYSTMRRLARHVVKVIQHCSTESDLQQTTTELMSGQSLPESESSSVLARYALCQLLIDPHKLLLRFFNAGKKQSVSSQF